MAAVRVLSVHAAYRCRQRGVCCAAGWPIPVEVDRLTAIRAASASGRLRPRLEAEPLVWPPGAPASTPALLARPGGRCVFFDADAGSASCRLHTALGHDALPLACRQFPRVTVRDPRGAAVTLSHVCPTAAAMLDEPGTVAIVSNAKGFPAGGEYVGLDATQALPPLLRADMALDWDSWWLLERLAVERVGNGTGSVDQGLAELRGAVEHVRTWMPGNEPLTSRIREAFESSRPAGPATDAGRLVSTVGDAIPEDLRRAVPVATATPERVTAGAHRRFLAAHLFANWTAYLGSDLRAWLRSVEAAHALLVSGFSLSEADLMLRHLADPNRLAAAMSGDS